MDFSATSTQTTYSDRSADRSWEKLCIEELLPEGKDVLDVGCGGGIYTLAFASLGARSVTGIDKSQQYIEQANFLPNKPENVIFLVGDATATGLSTQISDLVFERALIHHLTEDEQFLNAKEATRVLRHGGVLAVQDRTFENVLDDHPSHWIRSTLFKCFPRLLEFERERRPSESKYNEILESSSLETLTPIRFSERRKSYTSLEELKSEIRSRKGKSILFELTDSELERYCDELEQVSIDRPLDEIDQWTLWRAKAH